MSWLNTQETEAAAARKLEARELSLSAKKVVEDKKIRLAEEKTNLLASAYRARLSSLTGRIDVQRHQRTAETVTKRTPSPTRRPPGTPKTPAENAVVTFDESSEVGRLRELHAQHAMEYRHGATGSSLYQDLFTRTSVHEPSAVSHDFKIPREQAWGISSDDW